MIMFDPNVSPPLHIYIELTGVCNLKCPNCPRLYSNNKRGHMDNALFINIIDSIYNEYPNTPHAINIIKFEHINS